MVLVAHKKTTFLNTVKYIFFLSLALLVAVALNDLIITLFYDIENKNDGLAFKTVYFIIIFAIVSVVFYFFMDDNMLIDA
jgi:hypothetical protein